MRSWEIASVPSNYDEELVRGGVLEYGRRLAADGGTQHLACFVRAGNDLIGGGIGRTEYNRLFISSVWVAERFRGEGIGSEIITRMEFAARDRGCYDALIETLIDSNVRLYERLGYTSIAIVPKYVGDFSRYIMLKVLR
jgi:GNAT superfamily N-acetyltransferase